jgi:hypothetical protein
MLNKLKVMGGFYLYLYMFEDPSIETFMNVSICPPFNETFKKPL